MAMTMVEKILAKACDVRAVKAGDVVEPKVDVAMSHENAALVINQFAEVYKDTGFESKVWKPKNIVIILDHRGPAE
jgi:homoaconitase/3-isopropylmalate dehydratase large subunit